MAVKLRMVFTFLDAWGEKLKEEYDLTAHESYMKRELQRPYMESYWPTAGPRPVHAISGCFPAARADWRDLPGRHA